MNERIKELANQLGPIATIGNWGRVEWVDNVYPQLGDQLYAAIDLQKFAELIVRECMKVVINGKYSATECERNTHRIAHNNARDEASSDIKKHFGVEE